MELKRIVILYVTFTAMTTMLGLADLVLDKMDVETTWHTGIEMAFVLFAAGSATYLSFAYYRDRKALERTERELGIWKEKHGNLVSDMKKSILDQFQRWDFSPSEMKVALHLIRGYSHKQISGLLEKSERTVRNQSLNIYKKSGMAGRNELSAFFMEDLFSIPLDDDEDGDSSEEP